MLRGLCNVIPWSLGFLRFGVCSLLCLVGLTISIFQSSAQTVKLQKGDMAQAGLPIFLTAIPSSWIEQRYSWKVRWESRQSVFSEIVLAARHQGCSLSIPEQHKGFYSTCTEGRIKDACTCSGLRSALT